MRIYVWSERTHSQRYLCLRVVQICQNHEERWEKFISEGMNHRHPLVDGWSLSPSARIQTTLPLCWIKLSKTGFAPASGSQWRWLIALLALTWMWEGLGFHLRCPESHNGDTSHCNLGPMPWFEERVYSWLKWICGQDRDTKWEKTRGKGRKSNWLSTNAPREFSGEKKVLSTNGAGLCGYWYEKNSDT